MRVAGPERGARVSRLLSFRTGGVAGAADAEEEPGEGTKSDRSMEGRVGTGARTEGAEGEGWERSVASVGGMGEGLVRIFGAMEAWGSKRAGLVRREPLL